MKDQLTPFDSDLHEQLFAMFTGESNSSTYRIWDFDTKEKMQELISATINEYKLLWEDRSIANVEYEGFVSDVFKERKQGYSDKDTYFKHKIKFHFVEEE